MVEMSANALFFEMYSKNAVMKIKSIWYDLRYWFPIIIKTLSVSYQETDL